MVGRAWSKLGNLVGRAPVALLLVVAAGVLFVGQALFLKSRMRIKVEASDLLPADHPKNQEFDFIRGTFRGSSRGFFYVVEAPVTRLREVIPEVAEAARGLPDVDFIRWRIEREWFQDNFLLFQSLAHLKEQAAYLGEYHKDVGRLVSRSGSFADFTAAMSDIIDGEQEMSAPTDEAAKDRKLARDLDSLAPFLGMIDHALERLAAGEPLDRGMVDRGLEDLLLRGWFDAGDLARLDRELLLPEDVWEQRGSTMALVWVATRKSDFDPEFAAKFMGRAEEIRRGLAARFPDVTLRMTGGIASYNTWSQTVRSDFEGANLLGVGAVLLLLVVGFRALAPFVLLMVLLFTGTMGTLVLQNLLFNGVNMIATAAAAAIIGIGSDYGMIFLIAFQRELGPAQRDRDRSGRMTRKQWMRSVRQAIARSLAEIGGATTVGCLISAASFLALSGSDLVPLLQRLLGVGHPQSKSFQPIRELGVGGAVGLLYCLILMLVVLPAGVYLVEWVKTHPALKRAGRIFRPIAKRLRKNKRWILLRGRMRLWLRTDHEKRWFRALAAGSIRRRFWIVGGALVLGVVALVIGSKVQWSTGQKEVEPRHSEAVAVSERVEHAFKRSHENLLVYGPLDVIRAFHRRLELLDNAPGTNLAEVTSIDDFLPAAGEPQEQKIALAREIQTSLAGVRAALPPGDLMLSGREVLWLLARAADVDRRLARAVTRDAAAAVAVAGARADLARLRRALAGATALEPAAEWSEELVAVPPTTLGAFAADLRARADKELEASGTQAHIAALKKLARGLDASAAASGSVLPRRDVRALELVAGRMGLEGAGTAQEPLVHLPRASLHASLAGLERFLADSGIHGLKMTDGAAFSDAVTALEEATDLLALRSLPDHADAGSAYERALESTARLRRSIESLRSFAAASGFASVGPAAPRVLAALDTLHARLLALPPAQAEGVVRDLDVVFSERLFDRFNVVKHAAAGSRRPIGVADVPESARRIFSGTAPDGTPLYLARVLPVRSMLERLPYQQIDRVVETTLADVTPPGARAGYSGFEALLNLATDYLESTFSGAMITVTGFVLITLFLYNRSVLATLILVAPVALGTVLVLAMMVLTGMRITIFTVVALPIIIGVATDSSLQVFREYWSQLAQRGRAPIHDVMGETGKMVTLNSLSTVLPFGAMMLGDMKGLVALGTLLASGVLFCLVAKLVLLPCLVSLAQDYMVPAIQYASRLYPRSRSMKTARALAGRWERALPLPDPGFISEPIEEKGTILMTGRRPPLNLMDAALTARGTQIVRAFAGDPDYQAVIMRSGLPQHYHIRDARGELIVDEKGKPKKLAAALAEREALPRGYTLVGPIRTFGAGADLRLMAQSPVNALFTLRGAVEMADVLWYLKKPVIFIGEGDVVAGWFEIALCCNFTIVTRHARLGAPEVKRGLTLPFGAAPLVFRTGTSVARNLMATGELVDGEEAVRIGLADALVPDGEDPTEYAFKLIASTEFHDKIRQTAMLRQYGPPMRKMVTKSVANYTRMLRTPETRRRLRSYFKDND